MINTDRSSKSITTIGLLFIAVGIIFNEWILARLFSNDNAINSVPKRTIIWVADLIFILVGVIIIRCKHYIKGRGKEFLFTLISFLIFIFVLEVGIRVLYFLISARDRHSIAFADYVGWQSEENLSWKRKVDGYEKVVFSTNKYGFRVFGDIRTDKVKIFVLGDSYTHGTTVSDGQTYYDYLRNNHKNIEIFGYGSGGYGSLQEYMILDKYFDMIKPDLILWQFCSNDIVNNSYKLESLSYSNNNYNVRPYYDYKTGKITLLYPKQDFGWIYNIVQNSYLLKFLNIKLNILKTQTTGTIEDSLNEDDLLAQEAIQTTSAIMGMVRKRAGDIPIVAFTVDKDQLPWSSKAFSNISKSFSIHYINNIPYVLADAGSRGINYAGIRDSHWNNIGHSIVGEVILNYLVENKLLKKSTSENMQ